MPDLSIISCVAGREELFRAHAMCLAEQAGAERCEWCLTTWGDSAGNLEDTALRMAGAFDRAVIQRIPDAKYFNLPPAMNASLAYATADRCLIIGAEVLVPEGFLEWAMEVDVSGVAWVPGCIDTRKPKPNIGPEQKGAWPYAMVLETKALEAIGGWDEAFADGVVFDDVDLALRLIGSGVRFRWDLSRTVVHQHHPPAHAQGRPNHAERNRRLVEKRLNGYPMADIWPAWWRELYTGRHKPMPEGDGLWEQDRLSEALLSHGYPIKAT